MTLEADLLLDRRRLKRRLTLWRVLAVLAGLAAIWFALPEDATGALESDYVARLDIRGTITEDRRMIEAIDRAATSSHVRALIIAIDSPGGTVSGGEAIHAALTRAAAAKPVVATMGGTAASAGYMVALPAARIFAREGTLTGSIGVILQSFEASELLARLGVRPETIASGPLKDQPSPFRPLTEAGRASLTEVIADMQGHFIRMVAGGRNMSEEAVRAIADGRVMAGSRAREAGLVDAIGGEREARAWLAETRAVPTTLPIRTIETRPRVERWLASGSESLARAIFTEWFGPGGLRASLAR